MALLLHAQTLQLSLEDLGLAPRESRASTPSSQPDDEQKRAPIYMGFGVCDDPPKGESCCLETGFRSASSRNTQLNTWFDSSSAPHTVCLSAALRAAFRDHLRDENARAKAQTAHDELLRAIGKQGQDVRSDHPTGRGATQMSPLARARNGGLGVRVAKGVADAECPTSIRLNKGGIGELKAHESLNHLCTLRSRCLEPPVSALVDLTLIRKRCWMRSTARLGLNSD